MGSLQVIFLNQGSKPGLLHCRQILYCLSHQRGPIFIIFIITKKKGNKKKKGKTRIVKPTGRIAKNKGKAIRREE